MTSTTITRRRALGLAITLAAAAAAPAHAVIDGKAADRDQWPFIVALVTPGADDFADQFCAGTLIAPAKVLTAAHCVTEDGQVSRPGEIQVRPGASDLARHRTARVRVVRIDVHPGYEGIDGLGYDAAVLTLARPVPGGGEIRPATTADAASVAPGVRARIAGWGDLTDGGRRFPTRLRSGEIPLLPASRCRGLVPELFRSISDLCAGDLSGVGADTCKGDSGGPLVVGAADGTTILAGITSSGRGCGRPRSPGVYTRVSGLGPWLARVAPAPVPAPAPAPAPVPAPEPPAAPVPSAPAPVDPAPVPESAFPDPGLNEVRGLAG
ncbi:MAG: serine protease [Thermoleophilia bacterium]|jgi:secreted trypsin-like serine protease|nr:serine protease [Thermoleophilia bacterium]